MRLFQPSLDAGAAPGSQPSCWADARGLLISGMDVNALISAAATTRAHANRTQSTRNRRASDEVWSPVGGDSGIETAYNV